MARLGVLSIVRRQSKKFTPCRSRTLLRNGQSLFRPLPKPRLAAARLRQTHRRSLRAGYSFVSGRHVRYEPAFALFQSALFQDASPAARGLFRGLTCGTRNFCATAHSFAAPALTTTLYPPIFPDTPTTASQFQTGRTRAPRDETDEAIARFQR